ncbi:MAG: MSCRAMM family adhesin SdrC [Lachnospiraceae bacterium]|nr:MSCRAMM family adhesin SdrC [Lachnospiraceae bacterium]
MNIRNYLKGIGVGIIVASLVLIIAGKFNNKAMSDEDVIKRAKELGMVESTTLTQPSANNGLANTSDTQVVSDDKSTVTDDSNESKDSTDIAVDKSLTSTDNANNSKDSNGNADNKTVNASDTDSKSNSDSKTTDDKTANTSDSDSKTSDDKSTDTTSNNADKNTSDNNSSNVDNKTSNVTDKTVKSTDTVSVEVKSGMSSESAAAAVKDAGLVDDDIEFNKYLCANGYDKRLRVGQYDIPKGSDFDTIAKYLCGEQ